MLCALIMAGGKGERFWPMSTEENPKQFLNLLGQESMIQLTVKRLKKIVPIERIFIVTAEQYKDLIKEHIPTIADRNIIVEPMGKNTAACIALSALLINNYYENATIAVVPSDHIIIGEERFVETINKATEYIDGEKEGIVTIGIKPSRPDTGYGYIEVGEVPFEKNSDVRKVKSFKEKPNIELAIKYLKNKNYLWNSGMFVWKSEKILSCTREYIPKTYELLSSVPINEDGFDMEILRKVYPKVDNISVDYGIMERSKDIYVIKGDFHWDDLGSWNSLSRYKDKDSFNNVIDGSIIALNSSENIIRTKKKTYVMGIKDLIIVETDNEIMILDKCEVSKIKELRNYEG